MQRWPAVPMAAKAMPRSARSRSADGATIAALLPPSSRIARAKRPASFGPTCRPMAVEPVADTTGTRASSTSASPTSRPPMTTSQSPSGTPPKRAAARATIACGGERRQRRLLGRLPDDAVAAHEGERRVPGPDRDGEVEGRDDAADAERVPGLHHAVVGALGRDGQAVELARQADRVVADVDHLLHLAEALGDDLAGLEGDEPPEILLGGAQLLADQAHELAAARRRHVAPGEIGLVRPPDRGAGLVRRGLGEMPDHLAGDRRAGREPRAREGGGRDAEAAEDGARLLGDGRNRGDGLEHGGRCHPRSPERAAALEADRGRALRRRTGGRGLPAAPFWVLL